ncbi:MAG: ABC transporter permease, partial [Arcanobacterium sp.]|nr:ABC transporter permease [Arcanobacterium sp.]
MPREFRLPGNRAPRQRADRHAQRRNESCRCAAVGTRQAADNRFPQRGRARRGNRSQLSYAPWLIAPAVVAMLFLVIPLIAVLWRTPWADFFALISTSEALDALWLSLRTCAVSVLLGFLLGVPFAVILAKSKHTWWASAMRVMVLLPMVLPPVVAGLALLLAWGRMGLIGRELNAFGITIGFSTLAVIFAQTFVSMPFLITSLEGAMRAQGNAYDETARALGASRTRTFFTVSLPIMAPAVLSALALSFSRSLGEFGATISFAGSLQGVTRTMPLQIYLQRETDTDQALALAVILIGLAVVMLAVANVATARGDKALRTAAAGATAARGRAAAHELNEWEQETDVFAAVPGVAAKEQGVAAKDAGTKDSRAKGALAQKTVPESIAMKAAGVEAANSTAAMPAAIPQEARERGGYSLGGALARSPQGHSEQAVHRAPQITVNAEVLERGVQLRVELAAGQVTAVMGPNGSGKSTLLGLISGMLEPSAGGVNFSIPNPTVVLLQQNPLLFPHMSVLKNVEFGLRAQKLSREEARKRALQELALVGLTDLARRPSTQLSGGQAQRVAIARAMAI